MSSKPVFTKLFEPINIGSMTIKNRIAMSPMGTGFADKLGLVTQRMIDYYEARAKGGTGLIIVENVSVDFYHGIHGVNRPNIDNDLTIPGLTRVAAAIKKHGSRAAIQLNHSGRMAKSRLTGFQPVAPSAESYPGGAHPEGEIPRELTVEEIYRIVDWFAQAAGRAQKAGFEGIELHAGHAYLLNEFLSPFSNKRQDQFGGSLEKRTFFLLEVLRAIRKVVGNDFPLWCRINGKEFGVDGATVEDYQAVARLISPLVDAVHVSVRGYGRYALVHNPDVPGALLQYAEGIKKVVNLPVIAIGRITPELGEAAIREGKADIIAIGRGLLADPAIANKAKSGRVEDITPCISCLACHDVGLSTKTYVVCAVNAALSKERESRIKRAEASRKVNVIGGGPAGMEAARVLALRGHKVMLFEKQDRLGGQLNLAMVPPTKRERIEPLITYLTTQLNKLGVEIRLNTEATVDIVEREAPDVVVLAAGAVPCIPPLPGAQPGNLLTAFQVLGQEAEVGKKVVVIGGGSTGCETAEFLHERGKEVTIVEMLPRLAAEMGFRDRTRLMIRLSDLPIKVITGAKCREVRTNGVVVTTENNGEQFIEADTVVVATGMKQNNGLLDLLKARGFETYMIGDCWHVQKIIDAIGDGFALGLAL
ncbi:MAG: FAD-dependent oxidoreductase [Chloroflexi bacterium]|nr:FAD-dependent oxidoreductase [Chloroflexota bacterium]